MTKLRWSVIFSGKAMFTTREAQLQTMSYGHKRPNDFVCGVALAAVPVVSMIPALSKVEDRI
ncbi:hypothetical protein AKJ09_09771 [Labilithrix luteola]|uniref:Uncharacterized protein n=1 Tax=Labilithrix luteola TaxID=1391654 RepID=A0A0K1QBJ8_9BACT|nr:hypothetical protein AKJ09_09771 [Labilithrix luteola]